MSDTTTTTVPPQQQAAPPPPPGPNNDSISKREADLAAENARLAEQMSTLKAQLDERSSADDDAARAQRDQASADALKAAQQMAEEAQAAAAKATAAAKKNAALAYLPDLQKPELMIGQFLPAVELGDDLTLTEESRAALDALKGDLAFAFSPPRDGRTTPMGGAGNQPQTSHSEATLAMFRGYDSKYTPGSVYEAPGMKLAAQVLGKGNLKPLTPDDLIKGAN